MAVGGRTGRDGIHGATFSSAELTSQSETVSGGAVQIGNAITEKMLLDVLLAARDRGLYNAVTDCGAGGFSSAVGEMGEKIGAEVWLDRVPLKYEGLSYTEIWISEAQERMVLAVPPEKWDELDGAVRVRRRRGHGDRPVRAHRPAGAEVSTTSRWPTWRWSSCTTAARRWSARRCTTPPAVRPAHAARSARDQHRPDDYTDDLLQILGSLNVCSKEWVIRQYDHEVQGGSVIKPLVGVANDGPSDAAVLRPVLASRRGIVDRLRHESPLRRSRHLLDGRQRDRRGGAQLRGRGGRPAAASPSSTTSAGATPTGRRRSARWSAPRWPATTWPSRWARRSSAARTV